MRLHSLINFVLFQVVWFMCLLLEQDSLVFSAVVIVLMFYLSAQKKQDALLVLKALPLALLCEFIAVQLGLFEFKVDPFPLWLVFLWIALVLCINTSMSFLTKLKPWQAFCVCLLFAPGSYWAGSRFDVLELGMPLWQFWPLYGALWAATFTLILFINGKIGAFVKQ
ncbi:DUF2878 domain-containing protein [Pseudoalteromonas sp. SK18]|uniref:DUF2878 domain-containing protein n=1 Tax=Pseudoalteromonas sp. SK18 TaxID=1938366 RepID=UPI000975DBEF|nr:DUF2878 domain-containing protein [Pseudoalteromonas sp. SK18]